MAVLRVLLSVLLVVAVALARPKTGNTASHDPSHPDGAQSGGRLARPLEKGAPSSAHTPTPSDLRRNIAAMMAHRASPMGPMGHRGPMANRGPMPPMGPRGPMSQMGPRGPMSQMGPRGPMSQMGPRGPMSQTGPRGPMSQMGPGGPMSQMGPGGPMSPMGMRGPMPQMGPMMGTTAGQPGMMPHPPNGYPYPYPNPRPDSNETGGPTTQPRVVMTPMGPMMVSPPPPQGEVPGQTLYNGTQPGQPSPEQVQQMMMMQRMMMMREMARRAQMARMAQMAQMQRGTPGMPMEGGSGGRMGGPAGPMTMMGPAGGSRGLADMGHEDTDDKAEDDAHKEAADSRPKTLRDLILAARRRELQQGGRPVQMPPSGMPPSMGRPGQMPPQMMMPPVQMGRASNMPPMNMPPQMVLSQGGLHSYAPAGHNLPGTTDNDDVTYLNDESPLYANAQSPAAPGGNGMPLAVNGVPGPVQLPVKDLQSLMQFEYNMQHVRAELLKSFYADLVAYRMITQQIQRRMVAKLAMIQLVEARMAMPLRGTVAMGISPPSYSS